VSSSLQESIPSASTVMQQRCIEEELILLNHDPDCNPCVIEYLQGRLDYLNKLNARINSHG